MSQFARFLACGIIIGSLGYVTLAIGVIFASLLIASSKTPWLSSVLTGQAFLGFALCEAMALLILLIGIIILFS